jgi:DNA replication protein DnaC
MICQSLRNVPRDKLVNTLKTIDQKDLDKLKKDNLKKALLRWYEANIPVKYWQLEIVNNQNNNEDLIEFYNEIIKDIDSFLNSGKSFCFAGQFGIGKTLLMTSILKRVVENGNSGLYTSLTDVLTTMKTPDAYSARKEVITCDLLVIDEFDPRYMPTDAAADFCGRILEDIIRNRSNNRLPILLATNAPSPLSAFSGSIQQSLSSLWHYVDVVPFVGEDYRKKEK